MKQIIYQLKLVTAGCGIACLALLYSCEKTAGPQGPPGAQGQNGSNVEYFTFSTQASDWHFNEMDTTYTAKHRHPALNDEVYNKGSVQVFVADSVMWTALPWYFNVYQWNYDLEPGQINVYHSRSNHTMPPNPGKKTFRVVVIPPAQMKPGVNHQDYNELKKCYDLAD